MNISKSNKQLTLTLSGDSLPASVHHEIGSLRDASFPCKLHFLLSFASDYGFEHIISWLPCGTAFVVHNSYRLSQVLLPLHFPGMASFMSFRRQLNMHGIKVQNNKKTKKTKEQQQSSSPRTKKVTAATTKGVFSHPLLIRSNPSMCQSITRNKISLSSRLRRIERRSEKQKSLGMISKLREELLEERPEASTYVHSSSSLTIPAAAISSEIHEVSSALLAHGYKVLSDEGEEGMRLSPEDSTNTTVNGDAFFCSAADIEAEIISTFHQHKQHPPGGQQQSVDKKLCWSPSTSFTARCTANHHLTLDKKCLGFFHAVS